MTRQLQFQKLSDKAVIPSRAHDGDAGYDLFSAVNTTIPPRSNELVKTNVCVRLPRPECQEHSVYGRVAEKSGLALNNCISIGGGVIDKDYTGDIGVIMYNHADEQFEVKRGHKIAQLIVEVCMTPPVEEVDDINVTFTSRGDSGFGSTGAL